jgi:hypothetical protein
MIDWDWYALIYNKQKIYATGKAANPPFDVEVTGN